MDISKSLKNITNINDYISNTHDLLNKYSNPKIQFNMSTVLALKKNRSLEIEYFNKCDENGAAFKIFDLMLRLPPSKTWNLLGIELISLIQYWLDALRKHLIIHNHHWWNFLNPLLKFIQEIRLKDSSLNNILVQETMECLLDLATDPHPDLAQRYKIIQSINLCCADANREIRFALRKKFTNYFIKLSRILSSCGDVCTQYSIMETLLRWLLPRQDAALRREAAAEWFPDTLYHKSSVDIFLERPWHNFFKDARDFLNAHNQSGDRITSVVCKYFSIGGVVLVSEGEKKDFWLDLNVGSSCASLMLEPKFQEALGVTATSCDALVIGAGNVVSVQMYRNTSYAVVAVSVTDSKLLCPSAAELGRDIKIMVDGQNHLAKIDNALRAIFADKYASLIDFDATAASKANRVGNDVIDTKSTSDDALKRRHSGFIVRPMVPVSWQSPSTASTSSLAMLREKLTEFPGFRFDKEPVSVCAAPQLSSVTELSETEEHSFNSTSTLRIRRYGVCRMRRNNHPENSKCLGDGEIIKSKKDSRKCISPIVEEEENSVSCLLVATIGSANDSVINDTLERLPKDKDIHTDNIVDLLAQEALQSKGGVWDNKANTCDKQLGPSLNDQTTNQSKITTSEDSRKENKTKSTIISNTTTDESNTDVVEDTPTFVNTRKNCTKFEQPILINEIEKTKIDNHAFDNQIVEEFFSQHLSENKNRELLISPTLARKINDTSSESSEDFDLLPEVVDTDFNINDIDILECLNDMVDRVCKDFEKCTEYLNKEVATCTNVTTNLDIQCTPKSSISEESPKILKENTRKSTKGLRLRFCSNKKQPRTRGKKKKEVLDLKPKKMSTIIERESILERDDTKETSPVKVQQKSDVYNTPLIRRKRKLYSPKDDELINEKPFETSDNIGEKFTLDLKTYDRTPRSTATCYKELENIRRNSVRKIRNKNAKSVVLSPKTKKLNDVFDNLKTTIEGEKNITFANRNTRNKAAVYNFTSDSDDEDFKTKNDIKKRPSSTKLSDSGASKSTRRRPNTRPNKRPKNVSALKPNESNKKYPTRQRKAKQDVEKGIREMKYDLIDERMREPAPETLNVSLIVENREETSEEPEPRLITKPTLEFISDVETVIESVEATTVKNIKGNRRNKKTNLTLKTKNNRNNTNNLENKPADRDITESPLPGLVVEAMPLQKDPEESITMTTMLERFNNMSQEDRLPDLSEINTTQNLLSDVEPVNYSPPYLDESANVSKKNNHKDIIEVYKRPKRKCNNKKVPKVKNPDLVKSERSQPPQRELRTRKIINISDYSDSLKSIVTDGKSPITAHGDFEEEPPGFGQLDQRILEPRQLEVQDLSKSLKHYYKCLNEEINESLKTDSTDPNNNMGANDKIKKIKSKIISMVSPSVSISRLSQDDIKKWLPHRRNSVFDSNASSDSDVSTHTTYTYRKSKSVNSSKIQHIRQKPPKIIEQLNSIEIRKSLISPIKLFDEFRPTKYSSTDEEDNCKNTNKHTKKYLDKSTRETNSSYSDKINNNKANLSAKDKILSHTSKRSTSSKTDSPIVKSPVKRKVTPDSKIVKRRRVEDVGETVTESAPSVSSVDDWLHKNGLPSCRNIASRDESSELSLKDSIENVLEKLDTTLQEIHHNTSKKFVSMFLGAQQRLEDMKEERRRACQEAATGLMTELVKAIDSRFTEIDRRSQEIDDEFMTGLKEQARGLLHEDCRQKRAMVTLLKEDLQAVIDHVASGNRTNLHM